MMKIYVAGKDLKRASKIMKKLKENGHTISYDWVERIDDKSDMVKKAKDEKQAIKVSDILIYLWEDDQESARYEAGMAMGLDKKIIISGKKSSHFFQLPNVIIADSDEDIIKLLSSFPE